MKLVPIVAYIDAVRANRGLEDELEHNNTNANIYLATQDPRPMAEFQDAAPPASNWTICYVADLQEESCLQREPENGKRGIGRTSRSGRLGLAMEANAFVSTTASNWS